MWVFTDLILQIQFTDFSLSLSVPVLTSGKRNFVWKTSQEVYKGLKYPQDV